MAFAASRGDFAFNGGEEDMPVKENKSIQRLPLGGGSHLVNGGKVGKKVLHIFCPEFDGMSLAAEVVYVA